MVANPIDYPFSSIKEVLGREPLTILDEDIVRLIGETVGSQKAYEEFIFDGAKTDLAEIEKLFEKEPAIFGSNRFRVLAQKKYTRRRSKQNNA